jgi:hypothetical protein
MTKDSLVGGSWSNNAPSIADGRSSLESMLTQFYESLRMVANIFTSENPIPRSASNRLHALFGRLDLFKYGLLHDMKHLTRLLVNGDDLSPPL